METILSVSKRHNQAKSRRKDQNSKCGLHWRVYFLDLDGRFRTKRISTFEAMQLKAKLKLTRKKKQKTRSVQCLECGYIQEDLNQETCLKCGK